MGWITDELREGARYPVSNRAGAPDMTSEKHAHDRHCHDREIAERNPRAGLPRTGATNPYRQV